MVRKRLIRLEKRGKIRECEEDNVLDYEEETEEEQEEESGIKEKKDIERSMWSLGTGWKVDPRTENLRGPQLLDPAAQLFDDNSFIEFFLTFFPEEYLRDVMLPATNLYNKATTLLWAPISLKKATGAISALMITYLGSYPNLSFFRSLPPTGRG